MIQIKAQPGVPGMLGQVFTGKARFRMLGYSDDPQAWFLTRGMARLTGVSLPEAVVEGWLSRRELAGLVQACRACNADKGCETWLAVSPRASRMPDFCPNKPAIEALAP